MRSRSCTVEDPEDQRIQPTKGFIKQEEKNTKRKMKVQREEKDGRKTELPELTKKDLLHLLGVMEGEVQAREDVIGLLKSDRTRPETLEAHYGSSLSSKPLLALQRDAALSSNSSTEDVYETPMAELDRLEDKQRETYRRMLEQLLLAEKCHRRTVAELDHEKRKHSDFMSKSDDFTNLLEQERERLKRLLEQEKAYQARQEQDHSRRLEKLRAELLRLRSFCLMLLDERQLHTEQIHQQGQKLQDLAHKLQEGEQRLASAAAGAKEDNQKLLKLEAELEHKAARSAQEQEEAAAKMAEEESQSRQLRLKLAGLERRVEELEENNKLLRRSEEELQELREKISRGECGDSALMAELENLRKTVLEMEGKDEEITKTETQCRQLRKKLQDEENHGKELRLEVDKLQKRMVELEKLEGAFNRSKTECSQLHSSLEKEQRVVKDLAGELETVKTRMKELEASEAKVGKAEMILKEDLMKLKSFTVILVDERKNMAERLKQEEQKSEDLSRMLKAEQGKVTEVTEKLIEESKKLLRFKSEAELSVTALVQEKDGFRTKLAGEEEKSRELSAALSGMKVRLEGLETEKEAQRRSADRKPEEDNRVKELTLEVERLRKRLKQLEVVEGDLLKTEDEFDLLEEKFRRQQDRADGLSALLDHLRNNGVEKGEQAGPEAELRARCKTEEARSRELQADVRALKEKIHELMNQEDQLSQLQADFLLLQQRLLEEEQKKNSMSLEVAGLTAELEAARRLSRAVRPSLSAGRMFSVAVASTAAQTDPAGGGGAEDETAAGFIRKSVQEENHLMSNLRQRGLRRPAVLERYPPASAQLGAGKSWTPWMKKKEAAPERTNEAPSLRAPGQPLRIRVTPDHESSTAILEITSPRAEDFFSSTAVIPPLGLLKPRITIVPKPAAGPDLLDRAKSPVTITTISRAKSPDRLQSPVSIITVSTTPVMEACASPEPRPAAGRTVIKVTPEKQLGAAPYRKYAGKSNIITTEDNKIHIHLGSQYKHSTALRSPGKMTSSITITPIASAAARPTASAAREQPVSDAPSVRSGATRIPMSKGLKPSSKAVLGVSTVTRLESRAESQSMKIELRKSTICGSASMAAGKS